MARMPHCEELRAVNDRQDCMEDLLYDIFEHVSKFEQSMQQQSLPHTPFNESRLLSLLYAKVHMYALNFTSALSLAGVHTCGVKNSRFWADTRTLPHCADPPPPLVVLSSLPVMVTGLFCDCWRVLLLGVPRIRPPLGVFAPETHP